jgi:hypothetical protein
MAGFQQHPLTTAALMVLMAIAESACHKKPIVVPVAPQPAPAATPPEVTPPPATVTPPIQVEPPPTPPTTTPTPPAEEPPKPPIRRPPRTPPPSTTASPTQPPRLGDLLTPQQQRQYNTDIDQSLGRAQASLRSIGGRQLNAEQHERVVQVENFIQQAQATRKSNLPGAKSLAERAEVLARDLVASLH